jgi:Type II secretion system (T2SS), protein E, N-terminal domain
MASRLSDCLVRDGMLPTDVVRAATARQAVYGGALDTALLELGALDEPALWGALATATGAPIPDAALFEHPDPAAAMLFDATWSRRCRAVPVGQHDGTLQLCCSEPVDDAQLEAAEAALGVSFEIFVVPEVRLAAARQAVYGELMSPRLLRVLARLLGAQPVRKWVKALAPATAAAASAAPVPAGGLHNGEDDGGLAEAEFDVPVNTYTTEPADIIESRASSAKAADEVARALAAPAGASPEVITTDLAKIPLTPLAPEATATAAEPPTALALAPPAAVAQDGPPPRVVFRTPVALPSLEAMPDDKEEQLCLVAEDAESSARLAALRVLRLRLDRPRVRALGDKLREQLKGPAERAVPAAGALGELRDPLAVPALIEVLEGPPSLVRTAARALVEIAKQDFGQSRKKWLVWWETHKGADRVDWLLEGLSHKAPEIRFSASEELRLITGEYFGYHFDLPKREREEAKERWQQWWHQSHARLPDRR